MKHKKLTLIELIITIMVLGLLAALAIPQFTGVKANADVASFKNDIDVLSKAIDESYIKSDSLPLGEKITLTDSELLDTIYATGDSGTNLYKIDLTKSGKYHSKLKTKIDADSYFIYSMETGKVFYTKAMINGEGQTLYTMEYIGLTGVKIGASPLINGMAIPVTEPTQTITGQVPVTSTVEVSVNGTIIPVTTEDVVFEGEINLMAAAKYKTFTAQATLSNGINTVSVKVNSSVSNFKINLGEGSIPIVPEVPTVKPVAVISMTPELDLTTTTNIVWGYENSTATEGRTITNAEWEGKQDLYAVDGSYTVKLRVQDSTGVWSNWTEKTFDVSTKPVAVITMTPETALTTTTNIIWSYADSIVSSGKTITNVQWEGKQAVYGTEGSYTVRLKVQDSTGLWSEWTEKTFAVFSMDGVKSVETGKYHTLVLKKDGTLWGTGKNKYGQLGTGDKTSRNTFVQVQTGVKSVVVYNDHTLIIKEDNTLWSTGSNGQGQLGTGDFADRSSFVQVGTNVKSVAAGGFHTLMLKEDNTVWATGLNLYGQLGTNDLISRSTFVQVGSEVKSMAAGLYHSMFIKQDNTLWTTGYNMYGQLGTGDSSSKKIFTQVLTNVIEISAGEHFSVALKDDNTVFVTGSNGDGQLGSGNSSSKSVFTQVQSNAKSISAGEYNTLVLKQDNTLWATGYNGDGQFGIGNTTGTNAFIQIQTGVKSMAGGYGHTIILKEDGSVWLSGCNSDGQLGTGNNTNKTSFTKVEF